jgi:C1A family cysteine protease
MSSESVSNSGYHAKMLTTLKQSSPFPCKTILPFPKEVKLPTASLPVNVPKTFRFKMNYKDQLKSAACTSVYRYMNATALKESLDSGRQIKPKYTIAPLKTTITMFSNTSAFTLTQSEYMSIIKQAASLPVYFNWMDNPAITRPFNQGMCGSCWAVAAATCLSDVFLVSKKTDANPNLSPTYLLSCAPQSQCDGGDPSLAVHDMTKDGICSSDCLDYSWCWSTGCSGDPLKHFEGKNVNRYIPPCSCSSTIKSHISEAPKYHASESMAICVPPDLSEFTTTERQYIRSYLGGLYGNTVADEGKLDLSKEPLRNIQALIKYHIFTYGPVIGGFHVLSNFMRGDFRETNDIYIENYSYGGVPGVRYDDVEASWVGSHAVVIVGWGEDDIHGETVPYWLVRNSWGTDWGNQGTFKMAMYGDDPSKKYQNRVSQFEYPSIVSLDTGIGITGGIILMKAGHIETYTTKTETSFTHYTTDLSCTDVASCKTACNTLINTLTTKPHGDISCSTVDECKSECNALIHTLTSDSPPSDSPPSDSPHSIWSPLLESPSSHHEHHHHTIFNTTFILYMVLIIVLVYGLYYTCSSDPTTNIVFFKVILLLFIISLLGQLVSTYKSS